MTATQFTVELDAEWAETVDNIHEAVATIGLQLLSGIVLKTPVDTGRARGNWSMTVSGPEAGTFSTTDPGGGFTIKNAEVRAMSYRELEDFPPIWISNNLPYIERLETGYSKQAPAGMVALTIAEVEAQFADVDV